MKERASAHSERPKFSWDHVGVVVEDLGAAVDFYVETFGATIVSVEPPTTVDDHAIGLPGHEVRLTGTIVRIGSGLIELHEYLSPRGHAERRICDTGLGHIAFHVEDIDSAYAYLQGQGVVFNTGPRLIDTGPLQGRRWVYGRDPWGVVLELCQHPSPSTVPAKTASVRPRAGDS